VRDKQHCAQVVMLWLYAEFVVLGLDVEGFEDLFGSRANGVSFSSHRFFWITQLTTENMSASSIATIVLMEKILIRVNYNLLCMRNG
jgi:hypothetical protein